MRLRRGRKAHYAGALSGLVAAGYFRFTFVQERVVFHSRLDGCACYGIMHITQPRRSGVTETPRDDKASALRRQHALNPRPQSVGDSAFTSGNPFFDSRDLVQVKYEMLRRVREDGEAVSQAAANF